MNHTRVGVDATRTGALLASSATRVTRSATTREVGAAATAGVAGLGDAEGDATGVADGAGVALGEGAPVAVGVAVAAGVALAALDGSLCATAAASEADATWPAPTTLNFFAPASYASPRPDDASSISPALEPESSMITMRPLPPTSSRTANPPSGRAITEAARPSKRTDSGALSP